MNALKERIKRRDNYFYVIKGNGKRKVYYAQIRLENSPEAPVNYIEIEYWNGASDYEVKLNDTNSSFVRVIEKENDVIIEMEEFYYTPFEESCELSIYIEKAKRAYGTNSYMITIEWKDCRAEPIHNRYIYLEHIESGEKFYFLKETIEADKPDASRLLAQFITRLPEEQDISEYRVVVAPVVRQKYIISD